MKIKTHIPRRAYIKLMFFLAYRKPDERIVGALVGALVVMISLHPSFGMLTHAQLSLVGSALVGIPLGIYIRSRFTYDGSKRLQEIIEYDITADKLNVTGGSFAAESDWSNIYKIQELHNWFLLYQTKQAFYMIPKADMTPDEITGLRNIFKSITAVSRKKLEE